MLPGPDPLNCPALTDTQTDNADVDCEKLNNKSTSMESFIYKVV